MFKNIFNKNIDYSNYSVKISFSSACIFTLENLQVIISKINSKEIKEKAQNKETSFTIDGYKLVLNVDNTQRIIFVQIVNN